MKKLQITEFILTRLKETKHLVRLTVMFLLLFSFNTEAQNNALNFDGENDYVKISNTTSANFTIEAWIKSSVSSHGGSNAYEGSPIAWSDVGGSANDFSFSILNNHLAFFDGSNNSEIEGAINICDGNWHRVAIARTVGGTSYLYVDGVQDGSGTSGSAALTDNPFIEFGGNTLDAKYYNGNIDELRIWNSARTQSQIQANMINELSGTETGLISYYNFNQGNANASNTGVTTLNDLTSNHNNGALNNFSLSGTTSNWVAVTGVVNSTVAGTVSANQTITSLTSSGVTSITGDQNLNGGGWFDVSPSISYGDMPWDQMAAINEGQSFKASISASWTSLKINVQNINQPGDFTLQIFSGNGVNGSTLLSQTVSISSTGVNTLTFSSPISLSAGEFYTFQLSSNGSASVSIDGTGTSSPLGTFYQNGNGYGGALYFINTYQINNANWDNLTLTGNTGNVLYWQRSTDLGFSNPTTIANTSTILYSGLIGNLSATTYFRAVVQYGSFSALNTNTVKVSVLSNVITQVTASQRGATLATLYATITADDVNASTYRFEVTNGSTVRTFDSLTNSFNLSQLSGGASYMVTYAIRVQTYDYINDIWSNYGSSYNVTTPNIPAIALQSSQCGITLATLATVLTADKVIGASSYRFEVSVSGSVVETYVSTTNSFNLTQLAAGAAYATAYSIRPAAQVNEVWGDYGSPCTVTTGASAPTATATTQLVNSRCGITLTSVYAPLYADAVKSATSYRFEATTGSVLQTYTTSSNVFNLTQLPQGVIYGTTYSIRVAYLLNGIWYDYGRSCTVTTPALLTTQLVASRCGATITSFYAPLYANSVSGATGYRFEVTNGVTIRTYDSSRNVFNLMQLRLGAAYNTTYSIRVAVQYAGTWQGFGPSCTVTTQDATTQLVASRCGATVTSLYAPLYANGISLAEGYRFEVSTGGSILGFYDAATNVFNLKQVAGTAKNTVYTIRVAVLYNGTYQPFGSSCTVTTASNANTRMSDGDLDATLFTAKAYPNPFATSFNLAIESSSDDQVEVKVYDMIGRELEARKATVSEWSTQELGNGYPQGVYNVIVTQGDQVKTIRMIKR